MTLMLRSRTIKRNMDLLCSEEDIEVTMYTKKIPSSTFSHNEYGDKNTLDTFSLDEGVDMYGMAYNVQGSKGMMPRGEHQHPIKTNNLSSISRTPSTEPIYFLPPLSEDTEISESSLKVENKGQPNKKESINRVESLKTSPKPAFMLGDTLKFPDPPEILSASEARAQVKGLIKPTAVVLSLPEQLQKDLNHEQIKFYDVIELCNAVLLSDIKKNQQRLLETNTFHRTTKAKKLPTLAPPNTPDLTFTTKEQIEESMVEVTNQDFDGNYLTEEERVQPERTESETISHPQESDFDWLEPTLKDRKRCNYVMVTTKENEATKLFDRRNVTKSQHTIKEIPINKKINVGKMQVSMYGLYECINLLLEILSVFDDKAALSQSETACGTSQVNVEKNVVACINTLVSFNADHDERGLLHIRANKGNIFVDAKEKYNAMFDSKRRKAFKKCCKDYDSDLQKPLPIMVPDNMENKSKCPSLKTIRKNVGTQVKCTTDLKNKAVPIPTITVNKPKYPSPFPSPYPSPKFNGKYKGGLKFYDMHGNKQKIDAFTQLNEGEIATASAQSPQREDKAVSCDTDETENNDQTKDHTHEYVNSESLTEVTDNRLNKTSLTTFSPKVSKLAKKFVKLPAMKKKFRDDSCSPYELPKSMMPLGSTKSFSTSHLNSVCQAIPGFSEVENDTLSVNSITTIADDFTYTDYTKPDSTSLAKQRATAVSPLYWIQNHQKTDSKENSFRTLLKKVTKPFKKSPTAEKKGIPSQNLEVKPKSVGNGGSNELKASETGQMGVSSGNELIPLSGRHLKVPSAEECKRRSGNFQSWLDAQNDKILAKQTQFITIENTTNTDPKDVFEEPLVSTV